MHAHSHLNLVIILCFAILVAFAPASRSAFQKISPNKNPTLAEAEKFIADNENLLANLSVKSSRADWVQANFITDDTEIIASQANQDFIETTTKLAKEVKRFDGMKLPPTLDRKFKLLKLIAFFPDRPKGA